MSMARLLIITCFLSMASVPIATAEMEPQVTAIEAPVTRVMLYRNRAAVTRSGRVTLDPGVHELRFGNLPTTIQPETIQARTTGPVKVLSVDFQQREADANPSPQLAVIDSDIRRLEQQLAEFEQDRQLIEAQRSFLDSIQSRATADAGGQSGSSTLDLEALEKQMKFVLSQRRELLLEERRLDQTKRTVSEQLLALQEQRENMTADSEADWIVAVTLMVTEHGPSDVELTYIVTEADWQPTYNIRASEDGPSVLIEYEATIAQRTGEDWTDIELTLSTAQPMFAANPPMPQPWFVEEASEADTQTPGSARNSNLSLGDVESDLFDRFRNPSLDTLSDSADLDGMGPSVTFSLPRRLTVESNASKQQRARIASIDAIPKFIHVAVPALTENVYLRGTLTNTSAYQLLPGRAAIFLEQDYVGPTVMRAVGPGEAFDVYFGADSALKATRTLLHKDETTTGLFGGGLRTTYEYRLAIENRTGRRVPVEMWDRYPVSRSEEIQVDLKAMSRPLATDKHYVDELKPQGLLKWILEVPAESRGSNAFAAVYQVHINRAKDIEITELPE